MIVKYTIYSPDESALLRRVMDDAVQSLPVERRTPVSLSNIARHILDCAATGERDPIELKFAALADLHDTCKKTAE